MATVLLDRHSGTEKPRYSLYGLFGGIERIVRSRHETVTMPIHGTWPQPDVQSWLLEHALRADLFIATYPQLVQILREHGWRGKVIYKAVRGAQWATGLRQVLPYLYQSDEVWCATASDQLLYRALVEQDGRHPEAVLLPYSIDNDTFAPLPPAVRESLRQSLGIGADEFVLVYATVRLTVEKNIPALLRLLQALTESGRKTRLLIAGEIENVPFYEFRMHLTGLGDKFHSLASELGVADRVQFLPWPDDQPRNELYNAADAFLSLALPHDESFGFTHVESMSAGLPVVAAAWGSLKDPVVEERSGFLADTWLSEHGVRLDLPKAYRAVTALMDVPALRAHLGRGARSHVDEHHAWAVYSDRVLSLLDRVLERDASAAQPQLTAFGRAFHNRFSRGSDAVAPVYTGFADPAYQQLMAPYVSAQAPAGDAVFAALPGKCAGEYFYSNDLLWPGRVRLTAAEAGIVRRLSAWEAVPTEAPAWADDILDVLVRKGLAGRSRSGGLFTARSL